jgi:hypothetical protein
LQSIARCTAALSAADSCVGIVINDVIVSSDHHIPHCRLIHAQQRVRRQHDIHGARGNIEVCGIARCRITNIHFLLDDAAVVLAYYFACLPSVVVVVVVVDR